MNIWIWMELTYFALLRRDYPRPRPPEELATIWTDWYYRTHSSLCVHCWHCCCRRPILRCWLSDLRRHVWSPTLCFSNDTVDSVNLTKEKKTHSFNTSSRPTQFLGKSTLSRIGEAKKEIKIKKNSSILCDPIIFCTYRASSVAHSHVTLDVKRRRSGKSERFHIRIYLRFIDLHIWPRAAEARYQFVIDRAAAVKWKQRENRLWAWEFFGRKQTVLFDSKIEYRKKKKIKEGSIKLPVDPRTLTRIRRSVECVCWHRCARNNRWQQYQNHRICCACRSSGWGDRQHEPDPSHDYQICRNHCESPCNIRAGSGWKRLDFRWPLCN